MDQKKELTVEEMVGVVGGITIQSALYQICPKCHKPILNKEFLRHLALCNGKSDSNR